MNIDRGKTTFDLEERRALRVQLNAYKDEVGLTWPMFAQKMGMKPGTLSAIASKGSNLETYSDETFATVHRFFLSAQSLADIEGQAVVIPGYQKTKTSAELINLYNWARRGNLVVVIAEPGLGKTASIEQYCATTTNAWAITGAPSISSPASVLRVLESALQGSPYLHNVNRSMLALSSTVRMQLKNAQGVVFADEAQEMSDLAIEELRAIHDETKCGLVLSGDRDLLSRIEGKGRQASFAQIFSRISFRHVITTPHPEDVDVLLDAWAVRNAKERAYLRQIAMKPGGGALRQMTKILELASIVALREEGLEARCLTHFEDAAAQLNARRAA